MSLWFVENIQRLIFFLQKKYFSKTRHAELEVLFLDKKTLVITSAVNCLVSFRTQHFIFLKKIETNLARAGLNSNHVRTLRRTVSLSFFFYKTKSLVQHRGHTLFMRSVLE